MDLLNLFFFFLCTVIPLFHMINAIPRSRKRRRRYLRGPVKELKGFSILVPCYNEQGIIETTIKGLARLRYPNFETIFINDGSTDNTMQVLTELLELVPYEEKIDAKLTYMPVKGFYQSQRYPHLFVLDKVNGGKADSLNAACDYAVHEFVVTLDADSILAYNALEITNHIFQDESVIAAGGTVHILQTRTISNIYFKLKRVVRFQIFEYMKAFYLYKASLDKLDGLSVISGAFGIFKKNVLIELNGFRRTVGEDMDITIRFQQYLMKHRDKKMVYIPEAICYTECPETWRDLFKQRVRWQKAYVDCMLKYWKFMAKNFFIRTLSFFFITEGLLMGIVAPIFMTSYLLYSIFTSSELLGEIIVAYTISILSSFFYSMMAILISRYYGVRFSRINKIRMIIVILLDLFFYRFIVAGFAVYGTIAYFFDRESWNKVVRTGKKYELDGSVRG